MINSNDHLTMPPFYTMEMMRHAAQMEQQGKAVYHLEVGESMASAPPEVKTALQQILAEEAPLKYCSALGLIELREAIANHYLHFYDLQVDPERIIVTPGSSLALYISLVLNFHRQAKIAIAAPSYPCYRNVIRSLDYELIEIPTHYEDNFLITPEMLLKYADSIDGLLIASPNNPTGSLYELEHLREIVDICEKYQIRLISDEIYHGITYDDQNAETCLKLSDASLVINGFSKYFAMTGWRLGWMIVPAADIRRYESFLQNVILCTSSLTQKAAIHAFNQYDLLNCYVANYQKNRDLLWNALIDAGLQHVYKPAGGFYIYADLTEINMNSMQFCRELLQSTGVAVAPGIDFSSNMGKCSIRLSFCQDSRVIERASVRINNFIKTKQGVNYASTITDSESILG